MEKQPFDVEIYHRHHPEQKVRLRVEGDVVEARKKARELIRGMTFTMTRVPERRKLPRS